MGRWEEEKGHLLCPVLRDWSQAPFSQSACEKKEQLESKTSFSFTSESLAHRERGLGIRVTSEPGAELSV